MATQYDSYVAELRYLEDDTVEAQYPDGVWRKIALLPNQILVRKDERAESEGGIFLPDRAYLDIPVQGSDKGSVSRVTRPREDTNMVRVLAIGKDVGAKFIEMGIHRGQNIMIASGAHTGIMRSDHCFFDYYIDYRRDLVILKVE